MLSQKCKFCNKVFLAHSSKISKLIEEVKINLPLYSLYDGAMLYSPLWDVGNGITLCEKCHNKMKNK